MEGPSAQPLREWREGEKRTYGLLWVLKFARERVKGGRKSVEGGMDGGAQCSAIEGPSYRAYSLLGTGRNWHRVLRVWGLVLCMGSYGGGRGGGGVFSQENAIKQSSVVSPTRCRVAPAPASPRGVYQRR